MEVSADNKKVRRASNKALPAKEEKKRDTKAKAKEETKTKTDDGKAESDVEVDEKGNIVLVNADFENPIIVHFKANTDDKDHKVAWKEVETEVKKNFNKLKIVYSRADPQEGDLAISSHKTNEAQLSELEKAKL